MWHTLTPDDIADSTLGKLVSAGGAPAVGSELRDLVAGDAAACAMHERRVHSVLVRHVLGWDASKQRSVPGGGLFGECMAWGGPTEGQARYSLHDHVLAIIRGMPRTTAQLLSYLESTDFIEHFESYLKATTVEGHPVSFEEMASTVRDHTHEVFGHVVCADVQEVPELLLEQHPEAEETPGAEPAPLPWTVAGPSPGGPPSNPEAYGVRYDGVPVRWREIRKRPVQGIGFPKNMRCLECTATFSSHDCAESWARGNAPPGVLAALTSTSPDVQAVPLDLQKLVDGDRHARATTILLGAKLLDHDPGHRKGCFGAKSDRCRYRVPRQCRGEAGVYINGTRAVAGQQIDLADIKALEIDLGSPPGFEYTSSHNRLVFAAFKMNTNTRIVAGSPGQIYYCTTYASKIKAFAGTGTTLHDFWVRRLEQEHEAAAAAAVTAAPAAPSFGDLCKRLYGLDRAQMRQIEMPATLAALWLINGGETTHYSHKFET